MHLNLYAESTGYWVVLFGKKMLFQKRILDCIVLHAKTSLYVVIFKKLLEELPPFPPIQHIFTINSCSLTGFANMTRQLMDVADGQIVLALEGG